MATTQTLKKKLNGVRSIIKVTKAMKTASTVKFSKISTKYSGFSVYSAKCRRLYMDNRELFSPMQAGADPAGPVCFVIISGNKGMCGSFNTDLYNFALRETSDRRDCVIITVGKWLKHRFEEENRPCRMNFVFDDIPRYEDTARLYRVLKEMLSGAEVSGIELIYPEYRNMMKQIPVRCSLSDKEREDTPPSQPLFFPDRESVVHGMADGVMTAFLHEKVLESALGAQAATLMTMRSAYDTATEYGRQLEAEINRKRQSRVTADVIETSSEFSREVN